jgi:hypothetical protein
MARTLVALKSRSRNDKSEVRRFKKMVSHFTETITYFHKLHNLSPFPNPPSLHHLLMILLIISRSSPRRSFLINNTIMPRLRLLLKLIHRRDRHHISAHDMLANIPRQLLGVVLSMLAVADVEDRVQLLESESLGLRK